MSHVLDASALMAFIKKEEGYKPVYDLFKNEKAEKRTVSMHQINFIEFTYAILRYFPQQKAKHAIVEITEDSPLDIINFLDQEMGLYAAYLKARHALSLGDAIGLSWTRRCSGIFWTADKALESVAGQENISLRLIR